jgi:hypothetical protein
MLDGHVRRDMEDCSCSRQKCTCAVVHGGGGGGCGPAEEREAAEQYRCVTVQFQSSPIQDAPRLASSRLLLLLLFPSCHVPNGGGTLYIAVQYSTVRICRHQLTSSHPVARTHVHTHPGSDIQWRSDAGFTWLSEIHILHKPRPNTNQLSQTS